MSNRTNLIIKLAKEAIDSTKHSYDWKIVKQDINNIMTSTRGTSTNDSKNNITLEYNKDDPLSMEYQSQNIIEEINGGSNIEGTSSNKTQLEPDTNYIILESDDQLAMEYQSQNIIEDINNVSNMEVIETDQQHVSEHSLSEPFSSDDTNADPNYESESSSSSSNEGTKLENIGRNETEINHSRKRKVKDPSQTVKKGKTRLSNPENWIKNSAKRLRNSGESYTSSSSRKKVIPARKLLPPCNDKCKLKCCTKFTEEDRKKIFDDYWGLSDLEKQRHFLSASMTPVNPKYRYVREDSHRRPNNAFYFEIRGQRVRICKLFFKSTLCITDRPLRTVLLKQNLFTGQMLSSDLRGKHGHHAKVDETIKNGIKEHIKLIPRIESHYCRANTKKEYIEGGKTIAQLHRDYKEGCDKKNNPAGNYMMYARIFNEEFNLSFFVPKKDQCVLCTGYNNAVGEEKLKLKDKYDTHRLETELSRKEKENDKRFDSIVAVYDLQAVLPCPSGDVSSFYYVSKINVFNLTVCNIQTKDVQCYVWHEGEAKRGVNEIGSCVLRYLDMIVQYKKRDNATRDQKKINVIFYSDNCAGQQKNRFMIAAYMHAVLKYEDLESITHKFLISGHSQNEGDSAHSVIERQIKQSKRSGPVYLPDQYVTLIRSAKKTGQPYKVDEICHEDIFDLKQLAADLGFHSFPKNGNGEPVRVSDIKVIKIMKEFPGTLFYKTSYEQDQYDSVLVLNHRKKTRKPQLKKVYNRKVGITEKKKTGLLSLFGKNCIPKNYLPFYESL